MTDLIGAPPEKGGLPHHDPNTVRVLNARHVGILDQDVEWCARSGTLRLDDMAGSHARHLVEFLRRQAAYLCIHYWSYRMRQLAPDGELSDGRASELHRLEMAATSASRDPGRWLNDTPLMRRLKEIARYQCWCGGDVGKREPGDALGLGCLEDITHYWHPYPDHPFEGSTIGFGCARMVTDQHGHGDVCGLPGSHPIHLTAAQS